MNEWMNECSPLHATRRRLCRILSFCLHVGGSAYVCIVNDHPLGRLLRRPLRQHCGGATVAAAARRDHSAFWAFWHSASPREADIMILSVISEYFGTITLY